MCLSLVFPLPSRLDQAYPKLVALPVFDQTNPYFQKRHFKNFLKKNQFRYNTNVKTQVGSKQKQSQRSFHSKYKLPVSFETKLTTVYIQQEWAPKMWICQDFKYRSISIFTTFTKEHCPSIHCNLR